MNENKTTGLFWGVAVVALAIGVIVSRSTGISTDNVDPSRERINEALFPDFKDPAVAASLKVSTFDDVQGQLGSFEVRKDPESGLWTIPSRSGYPADATEQMAAAANALIGLTVLDVQTTNPEDHDDLGVVEPKIEDLKIGDAGVGRLVTFKDESQNPLASVIIGKKKETPGGEQIYVRVPGQNPVYVVDLDDAPLTTDFQAWIEEDLLQLSSIDITQMQVKDYNASVGLQGYSWNRNFTATMIQDGTEWRVAEILEYDPKNPLKDPVTADLPAGAEANKTKFDEVKNALDDLVIVDVVRKPDGMSANLRADRELVSDREAVRSLQARGFFPMQMQEDGDVEVLSANGELTLTLNDGVEYILRYGDVASVDEGDEAATGVNRYLLVTTRLDEAQFPVEGLQEIPTTYEQAYAIENPQTEAKGDADAQTPAEDKPEMGESVASDPASASEPPGEPEQTPSEESKSDESKSDESKSDESKSDESKSDESKSDESKSDESKSDESKSDESKSDESKSDESKSDESKSDESKSDESKSGETDGASDAAESASGEDAERVIEGEGNASGSGGGLQADATDSAESKSDEDKSDEDADSREATDIDATGETEPSESPESSESPGRTEQEKQEFLAAVQEKVGNANQRIMDARNAKIEAARRRVRELNARFADWYYVIPESTYAKLRIKRDDLFASPEDAAVAPTGGLPMGLGGPSLQGLPVPPGQ